jgi:hypothetical protein
LQITGTLAHALEVVDAPFHFGRMRDSQEVQHGIGRAAGGHDQRNGVFDRFLRDDVARLEIGLTASTSTRADSAADTDLFVVGVGHRR